MNEVLVLNSDYEPLNICSMRRGLMMVYLGKADVLHARDRFCASTSASWVQPSVVKLRYHVRRPMPELRLSRRTVFARDAYVCQYCGQIAREPTIDHVLPRRHGGGTSWENVVTACRRCNTKKGDQLLSQITMRLLRQPRRPRYTPYVNLNQYLVGRRDEVWRDYLPVCTDIHE